MQHDSGKMYLEDFAKWLLESFFPDQYAHLEHSESPDLNMDSEHGVEVTWAMFQNQGQANGILNHINGTKLEDIDPRYLRTMNRIKAEPITNPAGRICGYMPKVGNYGSNHELIQAYHKKKKTEYRTKATDLFIFTPLAQLDGWLGEKIIGEFFSSVHTDFENPFRNIIVYEEPVLYLYHSATDQTEIRRGKPAVIEQCKKMADKFSGWSEGVAKGMKKYPKPEEEQLYGEGVPAEGEITEPFNPKDVDIVPETMVVTNIIERLKDNRIILSPDFQRNPNLWDDQKQSRLIESLIVRIPLPTFYFDYDDKNDSYIVVDGVQRLWAIRRFAALDKESPERLCLKGLEYLKEYEGKMFEELPAVIQRRIKEQTLITYVIRPGTPEYVRNSIFTRINTGGMQLTPAEIKNSIYRGQAAELLKELAHSRQFTIATNHRVDPSRMLDCELVNRFLAFYILDISDYKENLEIFLNAVLIKLKHASMEELKVYKKAFFQAMDLAHVIFDKHAFKKLTKSGRYSALNKPLFECVSVCFARLSVDECSVLQNRKELFLEKYHGLLREQDFIASITNGTAKRGSIDKRYNEINRIIRETIK